MYRSTLHSTTGVSPAELLFGRKLKSKLPEINEDRSLDEEMHDTIDTWMKNCGTEYFDSNNHAKPSDISPGETVIIKAAKEKKAK